MSNRFAVFILTHGRANRLYTLKALKKGGYTGRTYLLIDNEDSQADEYIHKYGRENVIIFDKAAVIKKTDTMDNFEKHNAIVYARNAVFDVPSDKAVDLCAFQEVPFILLSDSNYLRECTNMLFHESKCMPSVIFEMEQSSVSYNFAKMGIGATILSNRLVENDADTDSVYIYKIKSEYVTRDTYISYRKGSYFTFAMKKFLEMILAR